MSKRRKHPKLPNGYGSIQYLGTGRRNPYMVCPPVTAWDNDGNPIKEKPLCYVNDWYKGLAVLTAYHAGTFSPEMRQEYSRPVYIGEKDVVNRILDDYSLYVQKRKGSENKTFSDVFNEFFEYKYNGVRQFSKQSMTSTRSAFANCADIHDREFVSLRHADLQAVIDKCPLRHSSLELIVSLFHQMYKYADIYGYVDKDYSAHVRINIPDDDIHGVPFSEDEIRQLWKDSDDPVPATILIMIYSGFRVSAYKNIKIDLEKRAFTGGIKTAASKGRTVPIHSAILPLVERRQIAGNALISSSDYFRKKMYAYCEERNLRAHTPHDTRHTFSALCERYGVNEYDRKRMLGHKIADITSGIYGHRTLDDLREEIEKIPKIV